MTTILQKALEVIKAEGYTVSLKPVTPIRLKRRHSHRISEIITLGDRAVVGADPKTRKVIIFPQRVYKHKCAIVAGARRVRQEKRALREAAAKA